MCLLGLFNSVASMLFYCLFFYLVGLCFIAYNLRLFVCFRWDVLLDCCLFDYYFTLFYAVGYGLATVAFCLTVVYLML